MGKYKNPDYPHMSDEQKRAYLQDARRRGGQTRSKQESMKDARSKGFWRTMELHPFYARKYLRRRILAQNRIRLLRRTFAPPVARPRRPFPKGQRPWL